MRPLIGTVLVLLAAVLPLFRQRGAPSWDTLWAEDGTVFFSDAHRLGGLTGVVAGDNAPDADTRPGL